MPIPVRLSEVASEMDVLNEGWTVYLNRRTGEMVTVTPEDEELLEDPSALEDVPEWQVEQLPRTRQAVESEDYLPLPDKFEIHEWSIMERFARSVDNEEHRDMLDRAIHGRRAFRRFRDTASDLELLEDWYRFRDRALKEIARVWLDSHEIPFQEDQGDPAGNGA